MANQTDTGNTGNSGNQAAKKAETTRKPAETRNTATHVTLEPTRGSKGVVHVSCPDCTTTPASPSADTIVLALAAVFAALIAAGVAIWRQRKQLDAESKRLDKQLAHDRWMREVEELRQLVDEAAAAGLAAQNAVGAFRGPVRTYLEDGRIPMVYLGMRADAKSAVEGMQGFVERLELRLGRERPVPKGFEAWQLEIGHALDALEAEPPTKELIREAGARLKKAAALYRAFMEEAREYVALEPPDD
jgi:hypothetical protein